MLLNKHRSKQAPVKFDNGLCRGKVNLCMYDHTPTKALSVLQAAFVFLGLALLMLLFDIPRLS